MNRRNLLRGFRNGKDVGSYVDIRFEIVGYTDLGKESIVFDTDIHYIDIGEGDPVLLIHGIGQSLYTWHNNIEALVKGGFRVIAVDLSGFGYSGHPNIYYTAEEYSMILDAFLNSLNLKRVHIAAFSTGCLSAACFAADHPKRVGKLVFVSPGCPNANYPFAMKFLATRLGNAISKLYFSEKSVRRALHDMFFDATHITKDVVEGYYAPYRNKSVRETLSMCMKHFDDEHTRSLLKDIKSETIIFCGTDDKLLDKNMVEYYANTVPGSRIIRIRNCSHLLHEEKPVKFNDEMIRFLKKNTEEQQQESLSRSYRRAQVD